MKFATELFGKMLAERLEANIKWTKSPMYQRFLAESRAKWKAKPWHERARIRTQAWVGGKRVKLGEIIAGQRFDDQ